MIISNFQKTSKVGFYLLFLLFILFLLFPSLKNYEGNILIFFLYSLSVNCLLLVSLSRTLIFFFLGLFTWLGFWFKLTLAYSLNFFFNYELKTPNLLEAMQQYRIGVDIEILDKILTELSVLFLFISLLIFFLSKKNRPKLFEYSSRFNYNHYLLFLSLFFLAIINYFFGIYQKGFVSLYFTDNTFSLGYKFFYYIIPNVILCELIKSTEKNLADLKRNLVYFLILNFFLYTSMLSREFIFYVMIFLLIFIFKNYMRLSHFYIFKILFLFVLLCLMNANFSNKLRNCKINLIAQNIDTFSSNVSCLKNLIKTNNINHKNIDIVKDNIVIKQFSSISQLVLKRWVGLESIYLKKNNIDFLELIKTKDKLSNKNFIPGIYYLIYSQNFFIMFSMSFSLILLLMLINKLLFLNSTNDYLYLFFNYVIMYRVYHAGLAPINTIGFIILILLLSITLKKYNKKYFKNN